MNDRNTDKPPDASSVERSINRLVVERGALFDKSGVSFGLTAVEQERLTSIERELDECFLARRQLRAVRTARRFDTESPFSRRLPRRGAAAS